MTLLRLLLSGGLGLLAAAAALAGCCRGPALPPGAAASPTAKPAIIASLNQSWNALLDAMEQNDEVAITAMSVQAESPCRPLSALVHDGEATATRLAETAALWRSQGVTWDSLEENAASGVIGRPLPAMTGICFIRVRGVWKFKGWIPGG